jgi:membrane-anchored protein YejM (alkaline phosphatase superfamily)
MTPRRQHRSSVLFITLDSCRYDTFLSANAPNLKAVGELHRAMAPGNFTYSSHAAMFMGFTPGVAERAEPYINPKYGKVFQLAGGGDSRMVAGHFILEGRNIVDGFGRRGVPTIGTGAVRWFNPNTATGYQLSMDFKHFFYPGSISQISRQIDWIGTAIERYGQGGPVFAFLNAGETHVPYYFDGASWRNTNPCTPFGSATNSAEECRRRQRLCLEHIDRKLGPILEAFADSNVLVCADHGDCWGEDGLWEHGIFHEKVHEVPLLLRLSSSLER